jgi:hypothetical protein
LANVVVVYREKSAVKIFEASAKRPQSQLNLSKDKTMVQAEMKAVVAL